MNHGAGCDCNACERGRAEGLEPASYAQMAVAFWKLVAILEPLSPGERLETLKQIGDAWGVGAELGPMIEDARKRTLD